MRFLFLFFGSSRFEGWFTEKAWWNFLRCGLQFQGEIRKSRCLSSRRGLIYAHSEIEISTFSEANCVCLLQTFPPHYLSSRLRFRHSLPPTSGIVSFSAQSFSNGKRHRVAFSMAQLRGAPCSKWICYFSSIQSNERDLPNRLIGFIFQFRLILTCLSTFLDFCCVFYFPLAPIELFLSLLPSLALSHTLPTRFLFHVNPENFSVGK